MNNIMNKFAYLRETFKIRRCVVCSNYIGRLSPIESRTVSGLDYCEECANKKFNICTCCDEIVDTPYMVSGNKVCKNCFKHRTGSCSECNVLELSSSLSAHGFRIVCSSCKISLARRFSVINLGEKKVISKTFTKNTWKGFCGVEIECLNAYIHANSFIRKEIKEYGFSQGTDVSLGGDGVEFRSVPMNGDLLFDSIESFGKELNKRRYRVDKTCGLHIHLEVDKDVEYLKKLYIFYLRFEDMFFNMLPKSRRTRKHCERFKVYYSDTPEQIMKVRDLDGFKEMLYETKYYRGEIRQRYFEKRRCWANLHSIFYRGTLEIRSHPGTVNSSKIINWFIIHQRVLEFIKGKSLEEIGTMRITKKVFLDIFSRPTQNYIKKRWRTFINLEEIDLKTRAPVYVKPSPHGVSLKGDSREVVKRRNQNV